MQISCKCLNFIATSNSQAANSNNVGIISIGSNTSAATTRNPAAADEDSSMPLAQQCNDGSGNNNNANNLCTTLMHAFLQRFPRTFIFYSQCMEFFKQPVYHFNKPRCPYVRIQAGTDIELFSKHVKYFMAQ
ncbi:unnamed protein product [Ceratitis capitata]|uniref:(Mediterranean fruit fly) hypothetical protein n=1 Tax=Ceratitis capitata TaxID=7213 RepID=A0A811VB17_CERCA|nr:unnamed protein product [Ceratitis capitata]